MDPWKEQLGAEDRREWTAKCIGSLKKASGQFSEEQTFFAHMPPPAHRGIPSGMDSMRLQP